MNRDFLKEIVSFQQKDLKRKLSLFSTLNIRLQCSKAISRHSFKNALEGGDKPNLIAEIKKASPSRGIIVKNFNPLSIAKIYQDAGAKALSILTENTYFQGSLNHIKDVRLGVSLPILRKDFILDEYQIYESYIAGADAILLIAEILSQEKLIKFLNLAKKLSLDCLVEVHNEVDILKVLDTPVEIIGINNRNLHDFTVDINVTKKMLPLIPEEIIKVSESGIKTKEDILFLKNLGVNAVLIGEALLESSDISQKIKELFYG